MKKTDEIDEQYEMIAEDEEERRNVEETKEQGTASHNSEYDGTPEESESNQKPLNQEHQSGQEADQPSLPRDEDMFSLLVTQSHLIEQLLKNSLV